MEAWTAEWIAAAAEARLHRPPQARSGPATVTIDSRAVAGGALFVGLPGARVDGGAFAAAALAAGAWGVLVAEPHVAAATAEPGGAVLVAADPLAALQALATAWRRALGARAIGVTGSTGKTSTKDLLLAVLAPHRRVHASRANFNTEIGLPLEILAAPADTEVLVLEMGMRGAGQIAELARIAEPDVGVIVSIGPVHLELLGSVAAIAAAKAELIAGLPAGGTAVVPAGEPLLEPHLRGELRTVTFGLEAGDVRLLAGDGEQLTVRLADGTETEIGFPLPQLHMRRNLMAALAAAEAVGVRAHGRIDAGLTAGRGRRVELPGGALLIDDCYNANPMSMRAALDDLAATAAARSAPRRVAVLGDMLELGPQASAFHREIGAHAAAAGVDLLLTVGPLAARMAEGTGSSGGPEVQAVADAAQAAEAAAGLLRAGDVILVKASRGVGLEAVCDRLTLAAA